jgi:RNA polymerase sigma-70 factor (ECF subfamily)
VFAGFCWSDEVAGRLVPGVRAALLLSCVFQPMSSTVSVGEAMGDNEEDVRRAQQGDVRAFERLIAAHVAKVRRYARAFAANEADADDLAQEALIKVYRSIGSYRLEAAFSTWLYAVVRNAFLDVRKSRAGRDRAREESLEPGAAVEQAEAPAPDELMARAQERQRLWSAIGGISAEFRTAVVLFDVEGLSYEEIAAIEKVPLGTVKSRLKRGRDQLRRALGVLEPQPGNPDAAGLVSYREEPR